MNFILQRNHTLVSTMGHSVTFLKGKPTFVPPVLHSDALSIGAMPQDGEAPDVLGEEEKVQVPMDPATRSKAILGAIKVVIARNERADFTAAGAPTAKAVERETGFDVDRREINDQLQVYHDAKAAEAENA